MLKFSKPSFDYLAGYVNPSRTPCISAATTAADSNNVPTTPPPTYEYVLEEVSRNGNSRRETD